MLTPHSLLAFGEMVEWSITPVLKTGVLRGTGGSNPSLSAKRLRNGCDIVAAVSCYTAMQACLLMAVWKETKLSACAVVSQSLVSGPAGA